MGGVYRCGLLQSASSGSSGIYRIVYQKNWRGGCLCNYSRLHCGFAFLQLPLPLHERIPAWEQALDQMRAELLVQAREKMENLEESSGLSRDRIKKQLENKLGRLDDVALIKELEEKRTAMMSDISEELQKRKEAMAGKVSHNMQRFVKAYPNLNRGYKLHKKYGFGRKNKDAE